MSTDDAATVTAAEFHCNVGVHVGLVIRYSYLWKREHEVGRSGSMKWGARKEPRIGRAP
jgi:hypothetical protein